MSFALRSNTELFGAVYINDYLKSIKTENTSKENVYKTPFIFGWDEIAMLAQVPPGPLWMRVLDWRFSDGLLKEHNGKSERAETIEWENKKGHGQAVEINPVGMEKLHEVLTRPVQINDFNDLGRDDLDGYEGGAYGLNLDGVQGSRSIKGYQRHTSNYLLPLTGYADADASSSMREPLRKWISEGSMTGLLGAPRTPKSNKETQAGYASSDIVKGVGADAKVARKKIDMYGNIMDVTDKGFVGGTKKASVQRMVMPAEIIRELLEDHIDNFKVDPDGKITRTIMQNGQLQEVSYYMPLLMPGAVLGTEEVNLRNKKEQELYESIKRQMQSNPSATIDQLDVGDQIAALTEQTLNGKVTNNDGEEIDIRKIKSGLEYLWHAQSPEGKEIFTPNSRKSKSFGSYHHGNVLKKTIKGSEEVINFINKYYIGSYDAENNSRVIKDFKKFIEGESVNRISDFYRSTIRAIRNMMEKSGNVSMESFIEDIVNDVAHYVSSQISGDNNIGGNYEKIKSNISEIDAIDDQVEDLEKSDADSTEIQELEDKEERLHQEILEKYDVIISTLNRYLKVPVGSIAQLDLGSGTARQRRKMMSTDAANSDGKAINTPTIDDLKSRVDQRGEYQDDKPRPGDPMYKSGHRYSRWTSGASSHQSDRDMLTVGASLESRQAELKAYQAKLSSEASGIKNTQTSGNSSDEITNKITSLHRTISEVFLTSIETILLEYAQADKDMPEYSEVQSRAYEQTATSLASQGIEYDYAGKENVISLEGKQFFDDWVTNYYSELGSARGVQQNDQPQTPSKPKNYKFNSVVYRQFSIKHKEFRRLLDQQLASNPKAADYLKAYADTISEHIQAKDDEFLTFYSQNTDFYNNINMILTHQKRTNELTFLKNDLNRRLSQGQDTA